MNGRTGPKPLAAVTPQRCDDGNPIIAGQGGDGSLRCGTFGRAARRPRHYGRVAVAGLVDGQHAHRHQWLGNRTQACVRVGAQKSYFSLYFKQILYKML